MGWLTNYIGPVHETRDPLGREVIKIWVRCRGCRYEACQVCGGKGGWYEVVKERDVRLDLHIHDD